MSTAKDLLVAEVPTSSLCASLSWLLSYSEAGSLSLLLLSLFTEKLSSP
jgi:hypothetical protein